MASDVECITLDSDDDGGAGTSNSLPVFRQEQMVRCNLCVDPGLLPVEEDRAAHRRKVHGNKLFYCDVCRPGEKGAKGFEEYADIVKHVSRENGINENDKVNLHEMIRVPAQAEHLKTFRCKFCPGDGLKFVGLTEDTFLEHIYNLHGTKAPRRKPEKLLRECRVCGGNWQTDAELGRHISQEHILRGKENKAPFAGFGPMEADSEESDSEEEEEVNKSIQIVETRPRRGEKGKVTSDRSWDAETSKFLSKIRSSPPKGSRRTQRREHSSSDSSDDDSRLQREMDKVKRKRMRLESSRPVCLLCKETLSSSSSLETHLANFHREQCFLCSEKGCGQQAWLQLDQAVIHTRESRGHAREDTKEQLLSKGFLLPPKNLESMSCKYCNPPMMIVGDTWEEMRLKLFEHMEQHEDLHRDDEKRIVANTLYGCRMCEVSMVDEKELDRHMVKHRRTGSRKRDESPVFKSPSEKLVSGRGSKVSGDYERDIRRSGEKRDRRESGERDRTVSGDRRELSFNDDMRDTRKVISVARERRISGEDDRKEETDMFGCTLCGKEFSTKFSVYDHVQEDHRKPDSESVLAQFCSLPADLRVIKCKYCNISWPCEAPLMLKATLRSHREEHKEMLTSVNDCFQLECRACPKIFPVTEVSAWNTHLSSHSSPLKMFKSVSSPRARSGPQCGYCLKVVENKKELASHVISLHANQAFQCVTCQNVFPVMTDVVKHMEMEHRVNSTMAETFIDCPPDLRGMTCLLCNWEVLGGGETELKLHLKSKHPGVDFKLRDVQFFCRRCGSERMFVNEERMEKHVREHKDKGECRERVEETSKKVAIKNINRHLSGGMGREVVGQSGRKREEEINSSRDRSVERGSYRSSGEKRGRDERSRDMSGGETDRKRNREDERSGDRGGRDQRSGDRGGRDQRSDVRGGRDQSSGDRGGSDRRRDDRRPLRDREEPRGRGGGGGGFNDNWDCPGCKFDNFGRNRNCKKCNEPKPWDGGRGGGRGGFGGERGEDWVCGCGFDNFARNRDCYKCGQLKGSAGDGNANMAPLGGKPAETEVDYSELMRLEIERKMKLMMEGKFEDLVEMKEDNKPLAKYIIEVVLNEVVEQVEDNNRRMNNMDSFMQKTIAEVADPPTSPGSPDYRPASPDYTPAPDSPEYTPPPLDSPDTVSSKSGQPELTMTKLLSPTKTAPMPATNYEAGYDSPMANPSPTYQPASFESPVYHPAISPTSMDMDSSKFKCSFCMERFDIVFEVYEHLQEKHNMEDNEEVLKQHCLEPFTATYAPVPYPDTQHSPPPAEGQSLYQCNACSIRIQNMYEMYEHLEEAHNIPEDDVSQHCSLVQDDQKPSPGPDNVPVLVRPATPPPTQPPVSTIQLVPAGGPDSPESGDSGAISDDEEEEVAPPQENPNLLPIPRSQSKASSTRSSSPLNIETIEQLEIALAEDGDVKMVMSEELTKTEVYARFMEKYNKDRDVGEETTATFNLKEDKGDNVKPVAKRDMEIGNVSPEVVDKYFPGDTSEKEAVAEVEKENDEK